MCKLQCSYSYSLYDYLLYIYESLIHPHTHISVLTKVLSMNISQNLRLSKPLSLSLAHK